MQIVLFYNKTTPLVKKIIEADFFAAAKKLCDRYEEILGIVKQEYRKMAADVWSRLYPDSSPNESFIEDFVLKIIGKIPSKNRILRSFKYN